MPLSANTMFAFQKRDGTYIKGNQITGKIFPIYNSAPLPVWDAGLIMVTNAAAKQEVRFAQACTTFADDYTFEANPTTVPETPVIKEKFIKMRYSFSKVLTHEQLDRSLFDAFGNLNADVLSVLGFLGRRYAVLKWYQIAYSIASAVKADDTHGQIKTLTDATASAISNANSNGLDITAKIEDAIMEIETRITLDQFGEDRANIVILCSHQFYNIVNRGNSALGRKPDRIQTKGGRTISVDDVALRRDIMMGQNIKAKYVHKTETIDLTNLWCLIISRKAVPAATGEVFMWEARQPLSGNMVNGVKGTFAMDSWDDFAHDAIFVVKDKDTVPAPAS